MKTTQGLLKEKKKKMETKVEYNSKLALEDKVTFCLDGEELVGEVSGSDGAYWLCFWNEKQDHEKSVNKIFFHFEIPDRYAFRNQIIGRDWGRDDGIWPYTSSLEELKKMLDGL